MAQSSDADPPPHSGVEIWRYMDIARFLTLISERSLYFARRHELGDPLEGVWTRPASDSFLSREAPEYRRWMVDEFNRLALISCWHENEWESVAMWKLYVSGREGVALKSTVGRLRRVLTADSTNGRPSITRVQYRDDTYTPDTCDFGGILHLERFLFRKTMGYSHEREIRAVLYNPHGCALDALFEAGHAASHPSQGTEVSQGEAVPVNLSILIERIVVSPNFPNWAIGSLQKVVDAIGVGAQIEPSRLTDQPCGDLLGARSAASDR
jgi:hypothetical protein